MILFALAGCLLVALAISALMRAVAAPRLRTIENLSRIDQHGYATPGLDVPLAVPRRQQRFDSLAAAVGDAMVRRFSSLREAELQRQLIAAGYYGVTARRFLGYRVLGTIGIAVPVLALCLLGNVAGLMGLAIAVGAVAVA